MLKESAKQQEDRFLLENQNNKKKQDENIAVLEDRLRINEVDMKRQNEQINQLTMKNKELISANKEISEQNAFFSKNLAEAQVLFIYFVHMVLERTGENIRSI